MECPRCGQDEMREVTEPAAIRFPGRSVSVDATFLKCGACGKELWRPDQVEAAHRAAATEIRRREELLMPEEIQALRKRLGLDQREFERLLRVGKKTVTRWETGQVFQSQGIDNVMRSLAEVPGLAANMAKRNGVRLPDTPRERLRGRADDDLAAA
ncbi:MAG TPA: type II toxin-antitoxin system MqsA family antitoxin [Longimicrobiaceae bacterium]